MSSNNSYYYTHTALITALQSTTEELRQEAQQCTLHHWDHHRDAISSSILATTLTIDNLSYVGGLKKIYQFKVPEEKPSPLEMHAFLTSLLAKAKKAQHTVLDKDDDLIINGILEQLNSVSSSSSSSDDDDGFRDNSASPCSHAHTSTVELYTLPITSDQPGTLYTGPEAAAVWRWKKPTSQYRTCGRWLPSIGEAVLDGEWNAGRGFELCVHGVGDGETKGDMFRDGFPVGESLLMRKRE